MKTQITRLHRKAVAGFTLAAFLATIHLDAQTAPPAAPTAEEAAPQKLAPEDLDDLLGPIALYPDALVALILPASTVPSDVTLAARYLKQNGDDANVGDQSWDESVKGLARYPDVLKWMDDNLEWTTSLGEAFVVQPADVMNSIQTLRAEAKDKGNLANTPQQTVVVEKQTKEIRIVPTDPEVIYVPQYDPQVVYVQQYQPDYVTPFITFGVGFAVGSWLNYDCDWGNDCVYYGNNCGWNNHDRWHDRGWNDGNVNVANTTINNTNIVNNNTNVNRWQPSGTSRRQFDERHRQNIGNSRIARANAQVRHPNAARKNAKQERAQHVPKPARLVGSKSAGNHAPNKVAAVRSPNDRPDNGAGKDNKPNKPGNGNGSGGGNGNAGNGKGKTGKDNHPKPVSAAPVVSDQSVKPNKGGNNGNGNGGGNGKGKGSNADKPNAGKENADKPKRPDPAPQQPKSSGNGNKVKKPSAAPQQDAPKRPKAENQVRKPSPPPQQKPKEQEQSKPRPKVQQEQPKPRPQVQQERPKPRPQAQQEQPQIQKRPRAQQPKPQKQQQQPRFSNPQQQQGGDGGNQKSGGGNGGGNGNGDGKKKKKNKD